MKYPKRLIEVDLPLRRIALLATRTEKRFPTPRGHISTLHTWWARRPLGVCRAVLCAAIWPDPADQNCPAKFVEAARSQLVQLALSKLDRCTPESAQFFLALRGKQNLLDDPIKVREGLLHVVADFSGWMTGNDHQYIQLARELTCAATQIEGETHPIVFDPFAGGGAIPLEALRVGADVFSSDLNPIAILLERIVLEYAPRLGHRYINALGSSGQALLSNVSERINEFFPPGPNGERSVAYLWARTINCEGPKCGVAIPLVRSMWLLKKRRPTALKFVPDRESRSLKIELIKNPMQSAVEGGTIKGGSATCPVCGYTTPNKNLRAQLTDRAGGAASATLLAVAEKTTDGYISFRLANEADRKGLDLAKKALDILEKTSVNAGISAVPDEEISSARPSPNARGLSAVTRIGVTKFRDLYTPRQTLVTAIICEEILGVADALEKSAGKELADAVAASLSCGLAKVLDFNCSLSRWRSSSGDIANVFGRQALPIVWDFVETNPANKEYMGLDRSLSHVIRVIETLVATVQTPATVQEASATTHPLPNDLGDVLFTDPPYYDSVPYADLSDFFYVWHRRSIGQRFPELFTNRLAPKTEEAIWNPSRIYSPTGKPKDEAFYTSQMRRAFEEARRIIKPNGIGVVVFAHKSTAGWEAVIEALLSAGWIVTASWPVDTEMASRVNAQGTASLSSSVHIVCRPRENPDGSVRTTDIGDWRDVLAELPERIHEWMPRLAEEGVVGADAIFACLGPALEIFSRYARVEKASGEAVTLKEYLEQVWAAVAKEALTMVFQGADASGFEEDARLTAMWLWTLAAGANVSNEETDDESSEDEDDEKPAKISGYVLEYDAARKIAQGLGANLENLGSLVEIKGEKARLVPVAERAKHLFGKEGAEVPQRKRKKETQTDLFTLIGESEPGSTKVGTSTFQPGTTVLDRVHQSMLLFGVGRSEALKRFLVEEGVGSDARFWRLAQALSALYPNPSDEKRWVDGVLARKKGLGF